MKARFRQVVATFGWWQWLLAGIFVAAIVVSGLFTVRTVRYTIYWRLHRDQPIERWMTVNYVAHSYSLPPDLLWSALGLPPARPPSKEGRRPLGELATQQGKTFAELKATLEATIVAERAKPPDLRTPPAPPAPPPAPPKDRGGP